jgi:hypothetical protein
MQTEIEIPIQPPRVTLHRARAMRDELRRNLALSNERYADEIKALAFCNLPERKFHALHCGYEIAIGPVEPIHGKREFVMLHEIARFVAALERKLAAR